MLQGSTIHDLVKFDWGEGVREFQGHAIREGKLREYVD